MKMTNIQKTEKIVKIFEEIKTASNHQIPLYAYGDNEAACNMDNRLREIHNTCIQIIDEIEKEDENSFRNLPA